MEIRGGAFNLLRFKIHRKSLISWFENISNMESTRQKKISRLLLKEISEIFQREAREVSIGTLVSVTVVRISPDLGLAKVYLSIFPTERTKEVHDNINEHASQLRFALGKRVGKQLRIIPELRFFVDDTLDYVDNIDRLLKD